MRSVFLLLFILVLFLCSFSSIHAQQSLVEDFFSAVLQDTSELTKYADADDLANSLRLGIKYEGVRNKFLIGYDIDKEIKEKIKNGTYKYELQRQKLEEDFLKVTFFVPGLNHKKDFYFKSDHFISPVTYYTKTWKRFSTRYFNFVIQDSAYFNSYSADQLEQFTEGIISLLKLNASETETIRSKKINYVLCRDSLDITKITGFNMRGIYLMADDAVITTFNTHFHELAHLLINYKLKTLPLYTLPLLQEGFASTVGGRGGISRGIILDIGYFLQKSGYVPYSSLISYKDFVSEDASVTYPVAALYTNFLLSQFGINPYLDLYRTYSGSPDKISGIKTESVKLPSEKKFEDFLKSYKQENEIIIDTKSKRNNVIYSGKAGEIFDEKDYYLFRIRSNIILTAPENFAGYRSHKFTEIFPNINYQGAKYLIMADSREVNIFNLFTNMNIASYSTGLSFSNKNVPMKDGYFEFLVKKDIFTKGLQYMQISGL